jgi:hypothetical protein
MRAFLDRVRIGLLAHLRSLSPGREHCIGDHRSGPAAVSDGSEVAHDNLGTERGNADDHNHKPYTAAATVTVAAAGEPGRKETAMSAFGSFMTWIEKEEKTVYTDIIKYAPAAASLASLLFPQYAAAIAAGDSTLVNATELIQNAVVMVEQKYASSKAATGTGVQKSAEVLSLAGTAVTSMLATAGIKDATTAYIQSLIDAVVAILNIPGTAPATSASASQAAAVSVATTAVAPAAA